MGVSFNFLLEVPKKMWEKLLFAFCVATRLPAQTSESCYSYYVDKKLDVNKIDKLIQFVLALAGQEDDFRNRSLGPIHLVKYVYLADLLYAERKGETFTGVNWKFHHFGPWSLEVFSRIDPALEAIGAEKKSLPSSYSDDDYFRYAVHRGTDMEILERDIPIIISGGIKKFVHEFTSDTPSLLNYVYLTKPMLSAAPGEILDFSLSSLPSANDASEHETESFQPLSNNALKRRNQGIKTVRARVQEKLSERLQKKKLLPNGYTPPRYDSVYEEGQLWLDSLAGDPVNEAKGEVKFSQEIWKSQFRHDPDLS